MRTDITEVYFIQEVVEGLNKTVNTLTNLCTDFSPGDTVKYLIDFPTQKPTQAFPVGVFKRFLESFRKVPYGTVNRQFLKHRTVVRVRTAATATTGIIFVLTQDIEFIKAQGITLDFVSGFLCGSTCAFRSVTPCLAYLLCRRERSCPGQPCNKLIDKVQQSYDLVYNKVDSRGKSVQYGRSHSTQTVLKVL